MRFVRRYRTALASTIVLTLAAGLLTAYALSTDGYPVRRVELNDGGVWVTSDRDGLFGRLNRPAGSLDAAFYPPGGAQQRYQLDIAQDAAAVVARDRGTGKLFPVDVKRAVTLGEQGVPVAPDAQAQLAGGTIAAVDPKSGKVWAGRLDIAAGVSTLADLDPSNPPLAEVGAGAALAVGLDGTVHAVSAEGRVATIRPAAAGFSKVQYGQLGRSLRAVQVTAVGADLVVFDAATGTLLLPGGRSASIGQPDEGATLQQPGPPAGSVVVATTRTLYSVALGGGQPRSLSDAGGGRPAAPVRLGECVHAAWAGTAGGYVRSCRDQPATAGNLRDAGSLVQPMFRVNRRSIVLNDLASGAVWDLSTQQKVDDWSSVKPPPVTQDADKSRDDSSTDDARDKPPKAVDDTFGARAGRTTVLHVLDNDSDPSGDILSVAAVTAPEHGPAALAIAPDGQTVQVTVPAGTGDVSFSYTVDNGKGLNATAAVTVQVRGPDQNEPPAQRPGATAAPLAVPAGGTLSLPVLADWRDFDGDPVVLVDAGAKAGAVTTSGAGFVDYTAPLAPGQQVVDYRVSDGRGEPTAGAATVTVQGSGAAAVAATAQPDVARGQVGQPVVIRPLDNDLPGADPTTPTAERKLAGNVAIPAAALVDTDLNTGTVTVTASRPGTVLLAYGVAFGNAPFATGAIRVDVSAVPATPAPPVAVPDSAVLRGQVPAMVDVLANDFSPAGSLLVVQSATADQPPVQVAIIRGRWLRLNALTPQLQPNPQVVHYTVTEGSTGPVTGEVTVTQLGAPASDTPAPKDDYGAVRAGDTIALAVLDNDTTPSGAPLTLRTDVAGAPGAGRLTVTAQSGGGGDAGAAYVAGDLVRYVAPASVDTPRAVIVDYVAQNPAGDQAVGHAHLTVNPAPSEHDPDRPPAPQQVDARAVAGDTVTIRVPVTGVDPDGDSVTVTGIGSATQLGRVLGIGAASISYQAYPTSAGTDTVRYLVTDRYGKTGQATIRVAVVPPGQPQPPVAVDDTVTAAPGARLSVAILGNDLYDPGTVVAVEPLAKRNPDLGGDARLTGQDRFVELTAPAATGKPLVLVYAISGGIGEPSVAALTVRSQDGYNSPPAAADADAEPAPKATTVEVDVLAKAADQDGSTAELQVSRVFDPQAAVSGRKITLPVGEHPRAIAYELRDGGGATAIGLVHVPATGSGAPHVRPGQTITVPAGGSTTVKVSDYVVDPADKALTLTTTDRIWASPPAGLQARGGSDRELVLTATGGYTGPAAVTFEVTDGASLTDPQAATAVVTVPVQVGPDTPVLRCPDSALPVIAGGATVTVDVTSVCHVWLVDRAGLANLGYTARWQRPAAGVSVDGAGTRRLEITAAGSAVPEATGLVEVGVSGFDAVHAPLAVQVKAAPPPSVSPVAVDGVKAGETATVDIAPYVRSRLRDPAIAVLGVTQSSGLPAAATAAGSTVRITPDAGAHGTMTFAVVVSDVADRGRTDRQATGQLTLRVLGVPDAPGTPAPGRTVLSKVVELSWPTPANNGAPIDLYEVDYGRGTQRCPASPCTVTGLSNGASYTFRVKAHNLVGWGQPSPASPPVQPNTVPGAVTGLVASDPQDGRLQLGWAEPPNEGTAVQRYEVSWTGGGRQTVTGTSATPSGLDNETRYTFTVVAVNSQGPGPVATVDGQSAGAPAQPAAPAFTATNRAGSGTRVVVVSWPAVSPNGPGPTTYTLTRTGGPAGTATICAGVTATTCDDDGVANDGTIYTYTVTAANATAASQPAGHTSPPSPGARMEATATPDAFGPVSATATGADGQVTVSFDVPASHGAAATVSCSHDFGTCGSWTYPTGGQSGVTQTVNGLPNGNPTTIRLQLCNGGGGSDAYAGNPCNAVAASNAVTAYGPLRDLTIATSANGTVVNFTVSVNPNGKPATVSIQTSRQSQTFSTGPGGWSWSGSDDVGYSSSDTVNVTVSDPGRAPLSASRTQNTPPPPPSVTVSKGSPCSSGTSCANSGTCTNPSCAYIRVQTANFPGSVTCTFNSQHGNGGFVATPYGPNQTKDSYNWYGYPGEWVVATCGGVTSPRFTWY